MDLAILLSVTVPKEPHQNLNRSDSKPKPIRLGHPFLYSASCCFHILTLSSHQLHAPLFRLPYYYSTFGLKALKRVVLYHYLSKKVYLF